MKYSVNRKLAHLINRCGFKTNEIEEIRKLYSGEPFDPEDEGIVKLVSLSRALCEEYERLGATLYDNDLRYRLAKGRRLEILRLLFCGRLMVADVRPGINLIIGLVDAPSLTFFNYDATFYPALVSFGKRVEVSPKTTFGEDKPLSYYAESGLPVIEIGEDVWIGAASSLRGGIKIGDNCVISAGSDVNVDVPSSSVALGRPAVIKQLSSFEEEEIEKGSPFSEEEEKKLYLAVSGWKKLSRIKFHSILSGKRFNVADRKLFFIYSATHRICEALDAPDAKSGVKNVGLKMLFPLHGDNVTVGKRLHLDMMGTTKLGDNVQIGDDVTLGGTLVLGDNVTLSDGACLFSLSRPSGKTRHFFSFRHGFVKLGRHETTRIADNVTIGKNAVIIPGSFVDKNVPDGGIWAGDGLVKISAVNS